MSTRLKAREVSHKHLEMRGLSPPRGRGGSATSVGSVVRKQTGAVAMQRIYRGFRVRRRVWFQRRVARGCWELTLYFAFLALFIAILLTQNDVS